MTIKGTTLQFKYVYLDFLVNGLKISALPDGKLYWTRPGERVCSHSNNHIDVDFLIKCAVNKEPLWPI